MIECNRCFKLKGIDGFHKNKSAKRGHYLYCKDCRRAENRGKYSEELRQRTAKWRIDNEARHKVMTRMQDANKRAKAHGVHDKVTTSEIALIIENSGHSCYHCGELTEKFHFDHVKPLSVGGANRPWNIVVSCPTCNLSKGDKYDA